MHEEGKLLRYIKEKEVIGKFKLIKTEEQLFGYWDLIKDELNSRNRFAENQFKVRYRQIGRIDVIFRFNSVNYCGEIKFYPFGNSEFWDALKVVGYTEYYNFCEKPSALYRSAILMPIDKVSLEVLIISNKLKITLFGVKKEEKGYSIKKIDDNFEVHLPKA